LLTPTSRCRGSRTQQKLELKARSLLVYMLLSRKRKLEWLRMRTA
jgi:hypothetical protein